VRTQNLLRMFGYKKAEVEGKNVAMLMPQPFRWVLRWGMQFGLLWILLAHKSLRTFHYLANPKP